MKIFSSLCVALGLLMTQPAGAQSAQAGWRQVVLPGLQAGQGATTVALFYPTQAAARRLAMGPFTLDVAVGAPPEQALAGLIVLSHGTGGSELGHSRLAQALARSGYLVAALRHPGDNWQDRSLLLSRPASYFEERPRQVSRVIDALLNDEQWKGRIAGDAQGPWVGALGHSAGGYTVLALAGGQPDLQRLTQHCSAHRAADPLFCRTGGSASGAGPTPSSAAGASPASKPSLRDARVRAVVALAPVGAVFTAQSLASIQTPVALYEAGQDRWLVPRFHSAWIASHIPGVQFQRIEGAWHFAFMDTPSFPIPTEDGDAGADPPGFSRAGLLERLEQELPAFFKRTLR